MAKTTRDPATFGQARSMTCGWCGAELMQAGRPRMEPRRVGDFFCPTCQENNAPCCQCGERDCYLLPSGMCPDCTERAYCEAQRDTENAERREHDAYRQGKADAFADDGATTPEGSEDVTQ